MALTGQFQPPGDKSISHRIALFSLLANGSCQITGFATGKDCRSSRIAVEKLGCDVEEDGTGITITGAAGNLVPEADINCGNSGTTMRLLMGILAGRPGRYRLFGDESLSRRPMDRIAKPLRKFGARIETAKGKPPVTVHGGPLTGTTCTLPMPSAQLKSALLLAGIQAEGTTEIIEPVQSRDHTERLFGRMGASLTRQGSSWILRPGELTQPETFSVPGDPSSAAFLLCGAAMIPGSDVTAANVLLNPTRNGWTDVLQRMGVNIDIDLESEMPEPMGSVRVRYTDSPIACEIPAGEIPRLVDEIPVLALIATQCTGTTVFRGCSELRVKETDRLAAIVSELSKLGAQAGIHEDDLHITGPTVLRAPERPLNAYDDHRIDMTLRIAGRVLDHPLKISGERSVDISFPEFDRILNELHHGAVGQPAGAAIQPGGRSIS